MTPTVHDLDPDFAPVRVFRAPLHEEIAALIARNRNRRRGAQAPPRIGSYCMSALAAREGASAGGRADSPVPGIARHRPTRGR
ncbi:hypothetical protein C8E05_0912 [Rhodococcus wratislaviensis]|uniref:Uncharacterized protein n=1 Tax=Rhodococcus wratislaviensis TaxID=44752 RepID=A0AB38FFQ9_RHOWR|nr:hypothetical protein C8E05_0912 [Rhodococcus wratislaviensis]SPZ40478.1 Uncharacterised protein [Rhodococcus wratislaviensis]